MGTPQIFDQSQGTQIVYVRQPDLTYEISDDMAEKKIDKINSVRQAIKHILSTEGYSNPIYSENYGVELEQFLGSDFEVVVARIEFVLNDALLQDNRIKNVIVDDIIEQEMDGCEVKIIVNTIYGDIIDSLNVRM